MKVKVLATPSEKMQGVIGKESLDHDEIYVFVNVYNDNGFHMRGVPFPLDIAFLDKEFGILDIQQMAPDVGTSKAPHGCQYAVEANQGYFDKNDLKKGDFWRSLYVKSLDF